MGWQRVPHVIKENKRNIRPMDIIFWDVETTQAVSSDNSKTNYFWFCVAQYVRYDRTDVPETKVFHTLPSFWKWVFGKTRGGKKLWLIALNTDFDFRMSDGFHYFRQYGFYIHTFIRDSRLFILESSTSNKHKKNVIKKTLPSRYKNDRTICVLDMLNWFNCSVNQLGRSLGFPKLDMPTDYKDQEAWITYCTRDVEIIRVAFEEYLQFLSKHDFGNFAYTAAGQAFNAYRHRFMTAMICIHTNEKAIRLERESYYGGRTECFFIGEKHFRYYHKLDINSMYPYVMANCLYPYKMVTSGTRIDPQIYHSARKHLLLIAKGVVTTKVPCVPMRYDGKLIFPVGTFETTLCTPEIDLVEKEGGTFKPLEFSAYQKANLFRDYVEYCYPLRQRYKAENNEIYQFFVKILMNSLYGKFGQKQMVWESDGYLETEYTGIDQYQGLVDGEDCSIKYIQGQIWKRVGEQEGFNSLVAISSFVTSYARCLIWRYIKMAGINNCFYTDTDSLFVNKAGLKNLESVIDPTELGLLKLEETTNDMRIRNLKDYIFGDSEHIKGIRQNAVRIDDNTFLVEQWERLDGSLRNNRLSNVRISPLLKVLKRVYGKGRVLKSGRVRPFKWIPGKKVPQ